MSEVDAVIERIEEGQRIRVGGATPLEFLQEVYRNEGVPLSIRLKAAIEALPFVHPKLAVTALLNSEDFGQALEAAAARSRAVMQQPQPRVIEHQATPPIEDAQLR